MSKILATKLTANFFVKKNCLSFGVYDTACLNQNEDAARQAFADAYDTLFKEHGNALKNITEVYYNPIEGDAANAVFVNVNTNGQIPAVLLEAKYTDGTLRRYILKPDFGDRFTGVNWKGEDVLPYLKALLYKSAAGEESLICKFIPQLCHLPSWVWLIAAGYGAKETFDANENNPLKFVYGAGALMAFDAYTKAKNREKNTK